MRTDLTKKMKTFASSRVITTIIHDDDGVETEHAVYMSIHPGQTVHFGDNVVAYRE